MADTPLIQRPQTIRDVLYRYSAFTHASAVLPAIFIGISAGLYLANMNIISKGHSEDYLACAWLFTRCAEILYTLAMHLIGRRIYSYYPYIFIITEFIGAAAAILLIANQLTIFATGLIAIILLYDFAFFLTYILFYFNNRQRSVELATSSRLQPEESITIAEVENYTGTCTICLEQFKEGDEIRIVSCDHSFHKSCINAWLENHDSCPNCRESIN